MSTRTDPLLPQPRPPIDPARDPFVGNRSVDDNLGEAVRVALWAAIGDASHQLRVTVKDRTVTLTGTWPDRRRRSGGHAAIRAVPGVGPVRDTAVLLTPRKGPAPVQVPALPFVHVHRFCGADESSTGAAIRQAVATLDQFCAAHAAPPPEHLIVSYRNPLPASITLEIGFSATAELAAHARGDLEVSSLPAGIAVRHLPGPNLAAVMEQVGALAAQGALAIWQSFPAAAFRPWHGHPDAPLDAVLPLPAPAPQTRDRKSR